MITPLRPPLETCLNASLMLDASLPGNACTTVSNRSIPDFATLEAALQSPLQMAREWQGQQIFPVLQAVADSAREISQSEKATAALFKALKTNFDPQNKQALATQLASLGKTATAPLEKTKAYQASTHTLSGAWQKAMDPVFEAVVAIQATASDVETISRVNESLGQLGRQLVADRRALTSSGQITPQGALQVNYRFGLANQNGQSQVATQIGLGTLSEASQQVACITSNLRSYRATVAQDLRQLNATDQAVASLFLILLSLQLAEDDIAALLRIQTALQEQLAQLADSITQLEPELAKVSDAASLAPIWDAYQFALPSWRDLATTSATLDHRPLTVQQVPVNQDIIALNLVVDTETALAQQSTRGAAFLIDNSRLYGQVPAAHIAGDTPCYPGQSLLWRVASVTRENAIEISSFSGQLVTQGVLSPQQQGTPSVWKTVVPVDAPVGAGRYTINLDINGIPLPFAARLHVLEKS